MGPFSWISPWLKPLVTPLSIPNCQWCRRRGCKCTPKSFDLLKIWANLLKSGDNPQKFGRISKNLGKILESPGKSGTQRCLTSKNGAQLLQKKHMKTWFFWGHIKKSLHDFCGRKFVGKSCTNRVLFRQVWENSGKNPSQPQKCACSYSYALCGVFFGSIAARR